MQHTALTYSKLERPWLRPQIFGGYPDCENDARHQDDETHQQIRHRLPVQARQTDAKVILALTPFALKHGDPLVCPAGGAGSPGCASRASVAGRRQTPCGVRPVEPVTC